MSESSSIASVGTKIDNQEIRIYQHDVQEMREQYENARRREAEASQMLSIEKLRCKNQELEIERRRKQLEESGDFIRKLKAELDDARRTASGVQRELRENEIKSMMDAEMIHFKAQITGLEAKLKRKQIDLDRAKEILKEKTKSMDREVSLLKQELVKKEKMYDDTISTLRKKSTSPECDEFRKKMDELNQRIGSLFAINESLQDKINGMQAEKFELENKLQYATEDKATLQRQIDSLKEQLTDTEGTNQQTSCYLSEEIDKIKHQKAQLRCDYLQLKRNYSRLEMENKTLSEQIASTKDAEMNHYKKVSDIQQEKDVIMAENADLLTQILSLKDSLMEQQKKLEDMERLLKENEAYEQATTRQMKAELEKAQNSNKELTQALIALDSESERMLCKLRAVNQEKKTAVQESQRFKKELDELRNEMESECRLKNDLETMREENARITLRVKYLENELAESRTEHRDELSRLAERVAISAPNTKVSDFEQTINGLQNALKQQESQCRFLERNSEQAKKELESVNKEISDMRKRQCDLVNDNTVLRQALAQAVKKGEFYRDENAEFKKSRDSALTDANHFQKKIQQLENELYEMRSELGQKEKLVGYLQSIQQPKQMSKIKRNRSSSTLISASNDSTYTSDLELESQHCEELLKERDRLRKDLELKRKILSEKQNQEPGNSKEVVPLLKSTTSAKAESTERFVRSSPANNSNNSMYFSPRGTMRHDIHHIWKTQFITINSSQCGVCYEGVPHVGHIKKCMKCSLVVHARCLPNIMNTCGLPAGYADYYLGSHATVLGTMNGWVKLWSSDDRAGNKWRNAWAIIDHNRLDFYDSDQLAVTNGPPFRSINLDCDQWRIFNQMYGAAVEKDVLSTENAPMIIEIKLKNSSLFMLTPTQQAKQRWVQALQLATNRCVQRRASSAASTPSVFSLLLSLDSPMNLAIHCTQVLDDEWLLIGCEEGLFATNLHMDPLRVPFRIADVKSIYFMELIMNQDMLLVICDKKRIPAAIHLQQLRRALRSEDSVVQYTPISSIFDCHTAVVSKQEHSYKRYVYLATTDAIHVLQFVEKLGVFSPVKQIKTDEPCMCICSTPFGFIYGADQFHVVTFEDNFLSVQLSIDNCPSDFPVAAVEISPNEYLLAYTNYGVFVTAHGRRTRKENVEWSRLPLEFVYTAPYLYIVYCDFLEIVRVAAYEGENSPGFAEGRSMFKCRSAHQTGMGRNPSDVLFSVSSDERVELHLFHTDNENGKSILKRKLADTLTRPTHKKRF